MDLKYSSFNNHQVQWQLYVSPALMFKKKLYFGNKLYLCYVYNMILTTNSNYFPKSINWVVTETQMFTARYKLNVEELF